VSNTGEKSSVPIGLLIIPNNLGSGPMKTSFKDSGNKMHNRVTRIPTGGKNFSSPDNQTYFETHQNFLPLGSFLGHKVAGA
jgi:hypothetical protein